MAHTAFEQTSAPTVHSSLTASFSTGITLPINFRLSLLKRFRALLSHYEQQFEHALYTDLRKHRYEVMTFDFSPVYMDLAYLINNLHRLSKPERASLEFGASVLLEKHPKGTVLVFGPFNYPIQSVLRPVIAAIAAGNTVCAKPSELTPATEEVFMKLANALDSRIFKVITGSVAVAQELLELKWDHIVFTGSGTTGRAVMTAAAKHLTPVTLELGGKSPCIVSSTAHIPTAVSSIVRARYLNCGQTCLAVDYCLIDNSVYDQFKERLLAEVSLTFGNDPKTCATYGRIVNSRHFKRVSSLLEDTKGTMLIGGECDEHDQYYIAPTVVELDDEDDILMADEIFGPILPILRIQNIQEAIDFVNGRDRPLALYLFSQKDSEKKHVLMHTRSGTAAVNETIIQIGPIGSLIGGVGESGMGAYGFSAGFAALSHLRPVMYSTPFWARMIGFVLPPGCFVRLSERQMKIAERVEHILGRRPFPNSDGATFLDMLLLRGVRNKIGNILKGCWKGFLGLVTLPLRIFRSPS